MSVVELKPHERPLPTGLVDLYLEYSKDLPSPHVFRLWTAIHATGASVERRVWTQFGRLRLYPNLFVFLVGPPGTGKTVALNPMVELLHKAQPVTLSPNDITKQGLLDCLGSATREVMLDGKPFGYHFLAIHISELSNFMSQYDSALAGLLTDLFDCPPVNDEKKRGHDKGKVINFPGISMIVGTATQNLGHTIADEMWGSGFMARVIMVYSADDVRPLDRFKVYETDEAVYNALIERLHNLGAFKGPMDWDLRAQTLINEFSLNQEEGAPLHNRLQYYVKRRWIHLAKLCMISALQDERMLVVESDFDRALEWLMAAEAEMTEVFKDMQSHTDGQLHEEMRQQFFQLYLKTKRPITHQMMVEWLRSRTASHNIPRFIEIAAASGNFRRVAGTSGEDAEFIPQPPRGSKNLDIM